MISFYCAGCGHKYRVPEEYAGKKARCKKCNHINTIAYPKEPAKVTDSGSSTIMASVVDAEHENIFSEYAETQPVSPTYSARQQNASSKSYLKVVIPIGIAAVVIISLLLWFALRDTWEKDNYPRLSRLADEASTLVSEKEYVDALEIYNEILAELDQRELKKDYMITLMSDVENQLSETKNKERQAIYAKAVKLFRNRNLSSITDSEILKARKIFLEIASSGNPEAMRLLGYSFSDGKPITQDISKAIEWYRKAALAGDGDAMEEIGSCYYNGKGVPKDYSRAVEWFTKSAKTGNYTAMGYLAVCYGYGKGVSKDVGKAVEWRRKPEF